MKIAEQKIKEQKQKALDMIGKVYNTEVKCKALSIDEKRHTAIFVISTYNLDRHGDIVDQDSWIIDHFLNNPAFFLQHRSDLFPIGKWLKVWLEADPDNIGHQRLVGEAEFRVEYEDAARAFNHVVKGDMNAVSAGFIPHRVDYDEDRDAFVLYDCELLEASLVGIPSNRQALVKTDPEEEKVTADLTPKEHAIEARKGLDMLIKQKTTKVVLHLKARQDLNRAIRAMRSVR